MRYLILPLLFAAPAFADEPVWPEAVTTAFFADAGFTTLRPADEIAANWALLTEADRQQVLQDCDAAKTGDVPDMVREVCQAVP